MSLQCVVGIFRSFEEAAAAVRALEKAELPGDQISFVTHSVQDEVPQEESLQYGDETERDATKGAGVGGVVGALLGAPLITIPGVGPLMLVGPMAAGAVVGGLIGAMGGWGVHEDHVQRYQEMLQDGDLLVVFNGNPEQVANAQRVLEQSEATEVHLHDKTSADDPSIHEHEH
ncbi:MAG: DUF1269 domain-containing protein [Planctomycetota bacterium]|nr:MAG: DUF1269 domain-containing protein [Planctomycetota bacterium]REJ95364.1 MAG: DUF1269 domain-containing protein [Planctomycetota bacterium]REK17565.1 MAG: DUF1269 domain-containing protein [Planctomycetota bacterium]REK47474.1 MAG: DUF1269 domain-containing protein [Planctomycetota bacterium]